MRKRSLIAGHNSVWPTTLLLPFDLSYSYSMLGQTDCCNTYSHETRQARIRCRRRGTTCNPCMLQLERDRFIKQNYSPCCNPNNNVCRFKSQMHGFHLVNMKLIHVDGLFTRPQRHANGALSWQPRQPPHTLLER